MAVVWSITPKAITPKGSGVLYVTIADYSVSGGTLPKTGGSFAFYNKPDWMKDILLRADGYTCQYYQKDT